MAFELAELAERMSVARERREHPEETPAQIEERVARAVRERMGIAPDDPWLRVVPPERRWPHG